MIKTQKQTKNTVFLKKLRNVIYDGISKATNFQIEI
mgnify:CR=1 FL=1